MCPAAEHQPRGKELSGERGKEVVLQGCERLQGHHPRREGRHRGHGTVTARSTSEMSLHSFDFQGVVCVFQAVQTLEQRVKLLSGDTGASVEQKLLEVQETVRKAKVSWNQICNPWFTKPVTHCIRCIYFKVKPPTPSSSSQGPDDEPGFLHGMHESVCVCVGGGVL